MKRNRLKIVMLGWALLGIAMVWIDRWFMNLIFGFVSCVLGVFALTARSSAEERDRREAKQGGILLIGCGVFITLLMAYDHFVLGGR